MTVNGSPAPHDTPGSDGTAFGSALSIGGTSVFYDRGSAAHTTLQVGSPVETGIAYTFNGWSGDASGTGLSSTTTMTGAKTATANWLTDSAGPVTSNVSVTPAAPPTVTATVSDASTGGSFVDAAEFFIDSVGDNGTGTAMSAADGAFDSSTETVTNTLSQAAFDALAQCAHTIYVHGKDKAGNWGAASAAAFTKDTIAPVPDAATLSNVTGQCSVTITNSATATDNCAGTVTGTTTDPLSYSAQGTFTVHWTFADGHGNTSTANQTVIVDDTTPPVVPTIPDATGDFSVTVTAPTTTDNCAGTVTGTTSDPLTYDTPGTFTVHWTFADGNGNTSTANQTVIVTAPVPVLVPSVLDRTVATTLGAATEFLYTGANAVQTGVAPGTIEPTRAAVLRGRVARTDGSPLSGVAITILSHPEFGGTLSRADGAFDLAVNGGGPLTVSYAKSGFLPVQRQVEAPWQDYAWLPDVVMIAFDSQLTVVDLNASSMQVARGNPVTDADGTRQATVLFPASNSATLQLPDGTEQPVSTLSIRATEYTVGTNGPAAMPAALPPSSGYTYCVELSADEALAAGATMVRFTQPVMFYVENFLGFPVGSDVPFGYYDRQQGQWIASPNGRVLFILSVTSGTANLDVDGSGAAADQATLDALSITADEQSQLGALYNPGQELWRIAVTHFSPLDPNYAFGPPLGAVDPNQPKPNTDKPKKDPCDGIGSIIELQNQIPELLT